jgi:hypothetical protein
LAQIFPKWTNATPPLVAVGMALAGLMAVGFFWHFGSPKYTDAGYQPHQPVAYSHKLHAGDLGMDCRYCHSNVEVSYEANIPSTQVCMNCHAQVRLDSALLQPVRESFQSGTPIRWIRVHKLPDYAYFDHSVHLRAGVGCQSCHGNVRAMDEIIQVQPLSMSWCLECHRDPAMHLRDTTKVSLTDTQWTPGPDQLEVAARLIQDKQLAPPEDCSACHR